MKHRTSCKNKPSRIAPDTLAKAKLYPVIVQSIMSIMSLIEYSPAKTREMEMLLLKLLEKEKLHDSNCIYQANIEGNKIVSSDMICDFFPDESIEKNHRVVSDVHVQEFTFSSDNIFPDNKK